jgi:uncharacterized protein involved in exopolysaccharide biosynthesis
MHSIWESIAVAVRFRSVAFLSLVFSIVIVAAGVVLLPQPYTVRATIRPMGVAVSSAGQLSSLAAQFGVVVPGGDGVDSPAFFVEFLQSWVVTFAVAESRVRVESGDSMSLVEFLEIEEDDARLAQEKARRWLQRNAVRVGMGRESGTVTIEVRTKDPRVSQSLASAYLAIADSFNVESRQRQANFEREFIERQVAASLDSLRLAEGRLRDFMKLNRQFETSPDLRFEYDRLQRSVLMRQQIYTGLAQAFEQARLGELRDTPMLTVVQGAYLPPTRDRLRGSVLGVLVLLLTTGLSTLLIFAAGPIEVSADEVNRVRTRCRRAIAFALPRKE